MLTSKDPAGVSAWPASSVVLPLPEATRESDAERLIEATSMLSVRGVPRDLLEKLGEQFDVDVAIINSHSAVVVSGRPADLELLCGGARPRSRRFRRRARRQEDRGAPLNPITEFLHADAPFHSHILAPAVGLVRSGRPAPTSTCGEC